MARMFAIPTSQTMRHPSSERAAYAVGGTPASVSAVTWRTASASGSKSLISSWNSFYFSSRTCPEANRRAVHHHELARRTHAAGALQAGMDALGDLAAILRIIVFLDRPHPVCSSGS